MVQDCFRIEKELLKAAIEQAKKEHCSRSSIYRKALAEYLERQKPLR